MSRSSVFLLIISFVKNKQMTKVALLKAWRVFENILPQFLAIITLIGIILALISPEYISKYIGQSSGWLGVIFSSVIGAITLIPGYIAFPIAAMILLNGAGYMQIGAFISSLMMVGVVTLPLEIKYFDKKTAIVRNATAFCFSFLVAIVIGTVMYGVAG